MNKYVLIIAGAGLGIILITLSIIVIIGRDPGAYVGTLGTLSGLIVSSGILAQLLGKTREEVTDVKAQTNGRLSALLEALEASRRREVELARALSPTAPVLDAHTVTAGSQEHASDAGVGPVGYEGGREPAGV
jgi:hypothetical protein